MIAAVGAAKAQFVSPSLTSSSVRLVDEVSELATIFEPELNVVTLRRSVSDALVDDARRASRQVGFRRLFAVLPASARQAVLEALAGLSHLAADLQFWIEVLAELTGAERVGVRLCRLDAAMCPRFHVDHTALRVVITYDGPGTELVANEHLDRSRLGHAALGSADEVSGLLLAPGCIRAVQTFDVVLLKGEGWPGNGGLGAVHRSPSVRDGRPRLVLTLDPLGDGSDSGQT